MLAQVEVASRFVTHLDVNRADLDRFVATVKACFATGR